MTTKKRKLLTVFVLATSVASPVSTAHAQLIINELMQSNIDCIMDDINEFPDSWVELYNSGTTAVNPSTPFLSPLSFFKLTRH